MIRKPNEVRLALECGAVVVVSVRVLRQRCGRDDCHHPTAEEAAGHIALAVLEAEVVQPKPKGEHP